jgi:hypothetical protein
MDEMIGQSELVRDEARDPTIAPPQRYSRRLSDKILIAFHHACDQSEFEVARQLLQVLEVLLTQRLVVPGRDQRRNRESLIAAHERLWHLRHMDLAPT